MGCKPEKEFDFLQSRLLPSMNDAYSDKTTDLSMNCHVKELKNPYIRREFTESVL